MENKRNSTRHKKRLRLRFGKAKESISSPAYTEDISKSGLFIKSPNVIQPGNSIMISLEIPDNEVIIEGRIMWAKRVPVSMIHRISKSGMGVKIMRISSGTSAYFRFNDELELRKTEKRRV